jgi:AraC-like DNA-binding protein
MSETPSEASTIVLIVTDPSDLGDALEEALGEEDAYRVLRADHLGEEALGNSPSPGEAPGPEGGPDLVISPLRPADRALALYRRVRSDPQIPAVPALLLAPSVPEDAPSGDAPASVLDLPGLGAAKREALRVLVAHRLAVCDSGAAAAAGPSFGSTGSFPERVRAVVERNLDASQFAVDDLADALGMSRRHLTRRMKDAFDAEATPAAYIRTRRLERAKALLAEEPPSVAAVAEAVGFRSASAFTKAFRQATGRVPTEYAREHGELPP